MDVLLIGARVVHVLLGVFWVGTLIFIALFLGPSLRDAGPEGGKVMAGLMRRRLVDVVPAVAVLTVLSGFYLYWRVSGGFRAEWMGSGPGITYGIGAVAALVALGLGLGILRPAMVNAAALGQSAASAPPEERDRTLAAAQALQARAGSAGRVIAVLLAIAVIAMAIARYV
jgi:hypothetical protein